MVAIRSMAIGSRMGCFNLDGRRLWADPPVYPIGCAGLTPLRRAGHGRYNYLRGLETFRTVGRTRAYAARVIDGRA